MWPYELSGNISIWEPSFVQKTDGGGLPDATHSKFATPFRPTLRSSGRTLNVGGAVIIGHNEYKYFFSSEFHGCAENICSDALCFTKFCGASWGEVRYVMAMKRITLKNKNSDLWKCKHFVVGNETASFVLLYLLWIAIRIVQNVREKECFTYSKIEMKQDEQK